MQNAAAIVVFCACENHEQAIRIAENLVENRLAACVNVLPGVRSIYRWQGKVERAEETLLLIKTGQERFAAVRDRIAELHSYDTPEILALPAGAGSERYLSWLHEMVQQIDRVPASEHQA